MKKYAYKPRYFQAVATNRYGVSICFHELSVFWNLWGDERLRSPKMSVFQCNVTERLDYLYRRLPCLLKIYLYRPKIVTWRLIDRIALIYYGI